MKSINYNKGGSTNVQRCCRKIIYEYTLARLAQLKEENNITDVTDDYESFDDILHISKIKKKSPITITVGVGPVCESLFTNLVFSIINSNGKVEGLKSLKDPIVHFIMKVVTSMKSLFISPMTYYLRWIKAVNIMLLFDNRVAPKINTFGNIISKLFIDFLKCISWFAGNITWEKKTVFNESMMLSIIRHMEVMSIVALPQNMINSIKYSIHADNDNDNEVKQNHIVKKYTHDISECESDNENENERVNKFTQFNNLSDSDECKPINKSKKVKKFKIDDDIFNAITDEDKPVNKSKKDETISDDDYDEYKPINKSKRDEDEDEDEMVSDDMISEDEDPINKPIKKLSDNRPVKPVKMVKQIKQIKTIKPAKPVKKTNELTTQKCVDRKRGEHIRSQRSLQLQLQRERERERERERVPTQMLSRSPSNSPPEPEYDLESPPVKPRYKALTQKSLIEGKVKKSRQTKLQYEVEQEKKYQLVDINQITNKKRRENNR